MVQGERDRQPAPAVPADKAPPPLRKVAKARAAPPIPAGPAGTAGPSAGAGAGVRRHHRGADDGQPRRLCRAMGEITEALMEERRSGPMAGGNRRRPRSHCRQMTLYLCHTTLGLPQEVVARALGVHRTSVAYACRIVEDRRDNPAIDALLLLLDRLGRSLMSVTKG